MATSTSSRALPLPRRASTSLKHEEILLLIRDCDALLQSEPRCLHTRAVRGHACMKAKLWERAVADFTAILEARPDDVHARFSRGMALFKDARIDDAHEDFSRVLELNPHHVMARYARAGCYNTEGKFHHAIEEYTLALQHDEMDNDKVVHGIRHGKLSRGPFYEDLSGSTPAIRRVNGTASDSVTERCATIDAVASWSPPKRTTQVDDPAPALGSLCSEAPIYVNIATEPDGTRPMGTSVTSTTAEQKKKPRKVVHVSLNLSDCVSVPRPPAFIQAEDAMPHNMATGGAVHPPQPPPSISVSTLCTPPQPAGGASGIVTTPQVPRRAVRRVTIAL